MTRIKERGEVGEEKYETTPLIDTCQYCSTSQAKQVPRSLASGVFKILGFVCKGFFPTPPSPPSFIFRLSIYSSRGKNRESCSSVLFCSETKRKRLLRRLGRASLIGNKAWWGGGGITPSLSSVLSHFLR